MKILIGYDGSPSAEAALDDLPRAGRPRVAEAWILTVGGGLVAPPPWTLAGVTRAITVRKGVVRSEALSRARDAARELAAEASVRVQSRFPGWTVRSDDVGGIASRTLIEMAGEWGADLLVVGASRRPVLGHLIPGGVSREVASKAPCTVRVARRGAPREEAAGVNTCGFRCSYATRTSCYCLYLDSHRAQARCGEAHVGPRRERSCSSRSASSGRPER